MAYTKLWKKILTSSVWNEDLVTKVVWITMLALKDEKHMVLGSIGGVAHQARVSLDQCREAIAKLVAPDPDDSSKVAEGRRLIPVKGGWFVVNGEHYRNSMDPDERRAVQAAYMREYRARKTDVRNVITGNNESSHVNNRKQPSIPVNTENGSSQESHGHSVTVQDISGQSKTEREKENTPPLFPLSPLESSSPPLTPPQKEKEREAALVRSPLMKNKDIDELSQNPAYQGIDVRKEAFKFKEWCQTNNRNQSKRRFVNWLNRVS